MAVTALTPVPEDIPPFALFAVIVAIYGVFGVICAAVAPGRGRSAVGWFFIGVFTQCIGVILIFLLPNLKLEEEKQRRRDEETRKLRELLKKERQVSDQRHDVHHGRIGAHDRALGVDTSSAESPQITGGGAPPPLPAELPAPDEAMWFYASDGKQQGPVRASRLQQFRLDLRVDDETMVWCEGMSDWMPLGEVADRLDRGAG